MPIDAARFIVFMLVWTIPFAIAGLFFKAQGHFAAMDLERRGIAYGWPIHPDIARKSKIARYTFIGLIIGAMIVTLILGFVR